MSPIIVALALAVTALMWWAAKPLNQNHAEQDDKATSRGGFTDDIKETK